MLCWYLPPVAYMVLTKSFAAFTFSSVALFSDGFHALTVDAKVTRAKWSSACKSSRIVSSASRVCQTWTRQITMDLLNQYCCVYSYCTCWIFVPYMEPLWSITNTTFFGKRGKEDGAKKCTKYPFLIWNREENLYITIMKEILVSKNSETLILNELQTWISLRSCARLISYLIKKSPSISVPSQPEHFLCWSRVGEKDTWAWKRRLILKSGSGQCILFCRSSIWILLIVLRIRPQSLLKLICRLRLEASSDHYERQVCLLIGKAWIY